MHRIQYSKNAHNQTAKHIVSDIKKAPMSQFKTIGTTVLCGDVLIEVKQIERSIAQFGLIMPLIVSPSMNGFVILDGKKRFAAFKRMSFSGTLPRGLTHIPYVFAENADKNSPSSASILSNRDVFDAVKTLKSQGFTIDEIANTLYLCRSLIADFIQLAHLSPPLKKALFHNIITFKQALAYSALPDEASQMQWLKALGPFADPKTIIAAISRSHKARDTAVENSPILAFIDKAPSRQNLKVSIPPSHIIHDQAHPFICVEKAA